MSIVSVDGDELTALVQRADVAEADRDALAAELDAARATVGRFTSALGVYEDEIEEALAMIPEAQQTIETFRESNRIMGDELAQARAEVERLREALKFYARYDHWTEADLKSIAYWDNGSRARAALEVK